MRVAIGNNMNILALDPSTNTGFAHSGGISGVFDLSVRRDESSGMRLVRLQSKLNEIKNGTGIDLLVFEAARHAAPKMQGALTVQAELQGVIKLWCENNGVEYRGYSPSQIKKFATGKGNANKAAMVEAAKKHWTDRELTDDNECDALWLLELATKELNGTTTISTPRNVETIAKARRHSAR